MPRRYFNWKLAFVVVITVITVGAGAWAVRQYRIRNSASKALEDGLKAYDANDWPRAAGLLGRYVGVNQNDEQVQMKYAQAMMKIRPQNGKYILAAAGAYRSVARNHPENLEAARKCVELYLMIGRFDDAALIGQRVLANSADPNIVRLHAIALVDKRQFSQAAEELEKLCAAHPEYVPAYETTGQLAEQHPEEFSEPASYWYDETVKNNPSSALAYIVRAGYYRRNNNFNSAKADLETAANKDSSDTTVSLRLASEYLSMNLIDKAQATLARIRQTSPTNQQLWQMLAHVALVTQSPDKMKATAEAGLAQLSSEPWDFMPLAAELFIRSGELDRAADYISQLNQQNFGPAVVSYLQGLVYAQKGDYRNAVKQWEHSIESGNNSAQVRLELASAFGSLGDTPSATSQLRALVSQSPDLFEGRLALAKLLAQSANWSEAYEQASQAVQLRPGSAEALLLEIQTQAQIAGRSPGPEENIQNLQNVQTALSNLDSAGVSSLETELLRFQIAKQKGSYTEAGELLDQLKQKYPSQARVSLAEAELLVAQNKIDDAINVLTQASSQFPDAAGPVRFLAVLLDSRNQRDECAAVITHALSRIDEPLAQRDLTLLLATFYTRWNQPDKVYSELEAAAGKLPSDIPIKRHLLLCKQVINDPQQSQQIVDEIKALEGEDGWQWRYEQARVWFLSDGFKEHYPQIVTLMQSNLLNNPDDQASRMLLAKAYEKDGELQLAIPLYREALNRLPGNIPIVTALVSALYKIREYSQADEILSHLPQQSIQDPQLQRLQLQNYLRQGHLDSASDILEGFIGSDPNNQEAGLALALVNMQQGKYSQAEEVLTKVKNIEPNSLAIAAAQIQLNLKLEKPQEALKVCDELVKNLSNASAYILRARTYATVSQPEKALDDLNSALAIEPENSQVWLARSDFYSSTGRQDRALEDIRKAAALDPGNDQIRQRLITLLLTSNKPEMISEGEDIVEQALKANPDDTQLLLYKANGLLVEGTTPAVENARTILQKITQQSPDVGQAWLMLGEITLRKGQPGSAMDYASRGLAYNPNDETLLFLKARAEAARSPVQAIPTLKVLSELNPDNVEAVNFLANIYIAAREPDKAVSFLENVLTKCNSGNSRTYDIALATAMYKAGSKTEARDKLDSLSKADPADPAPLVALAYLLNDDQLWSELKNKTLDWYQEHPENSRAVTIIGSNLVANESAEAKKAAEEILREVLKNNPRNSEALYSLALLLGMTGRSQEAADSYRRLLEIEPDNVIAINNLAWILCEDQGQAQQALDLAQKGLKAAPDYIDLLDTRGMIYFRLRQFQKAIQDFTRCLALYQESSPQATASRFHLAKAYAATKENNRTIENLEQVLDSLPQTGGLSAGELSEAQSLLKQLQEDN